VPQSTKEETFTVTVKFETGDLYGTITGSKKVTVGPK